MNTKPQPPDNKPKQTDTMKKPDDTGSVRVSDFITIKDPSSGTIYLEKRG